MVSFEYTSDRYGRDLMMAQRPAHEFFSPFNQIASPILDYT
jgi:hypothetical protein